MTYVKKTFYSKKTLDFKITTKSLAASGECIIEGYANTVDKDRVGDVVLPTAFAKSLPKYLENPVLLENHNWDKLAGKVLNAEIQEKGLYVKARISDTREDLKTLIREGCLSTFSIGYNEIDAEPDHTTKTKYIKELELLEISVVSIPANTEAKFTPVTEEKVETAVETEAKSTSADNIIVKDSISPVKQSLSSFIEMVKNNVSFELDSNLITNIVKHYESVEKEGSELMTKQELLNAVSTKSLEAVVEQKQEIENQMQPIEQKPAEDKMGEILAKLDMLGQAIGLCLEEMKKMQEESKGVEIEIEEDKEELSKLEEEAKEDEMKEEDSQEQKDLNGAELSTEQLETEIAVISLEIAALENESDV